MVLVAFGLLFLGFLSFKSKVRIFYGIMTYQLSERHPTGMFLNNTFQKIKNGKPIKVCRFL